MIKVLNRYRDKERTELDEHPLCDRAALDFLVLNIREKHPGESVKDKVNERIILTQVYKDYYGERVVQARQIRNRHKWLVHTGITAEELTSFLDHGDASERGNP